MRQVFELFLGRTYFESLKIRGSIAALEIFSVPLGNHFCFYNCPLKYPLKQLHLASVAEAVAAAAAAAAATDCKDQIVFAVGKISVPLSKSCPSPHA